MTGAAEQHKELEPKLVLDGVGTISAGQRSEGNEPVYHDECEKCIEESLYRLLYMLWYVIGQFSGTRPISKSSQMTQC